MIQYPLLSYQEILKMWRTNANFKGAICLCRGFNSQSPDLVCVLLTDEEKSYFEGLSVERRRLSYLAGRYVAKKAISLISGRAYHEISIGYGIFNNPLLNYTGRGDRLEVSISHSHDLCAAISFPCAHPMGIDVEKIDPAKETVIKEEFTGPEIDLVRLAVVDNLPGVALTLAWTVKESLSKVLKTGLMTPFTIYELSRIERYDQVYVSHFRHFAQYQAASFLLGNYAFSVTLPRKTRCWLNIAEMKRALHF